MNWEEVRNYVNQYGRLRDVQFAAYELYARRHNLTAKELFVLDILWFSPDGCLQTDICERLSATKQTISAIIKQSQKQTGEIRSFVLRVKEFPMWRKLYRLLPKRRSML